MEKDTTCWVGFYNLASLETPISTSHQSDNDNWQKKVSTLDGADSLVDNYFSRGGSKSDQSSLGDILI